MDERYKSFLSQDNLRKIREIAQSNWLAFGKAPKDTEENFVAKVYCASFLDALQMEGYEITIKKGKEELTFKKG